MANSLCFSPVNSLNAPCKSGPLVIASSAGKVVLIDYSVIRSSRNAKSHSFVVKAAESSSSSGPSRTKPGSIVCADCDGNGAVLCSQCKGTGVNSVDHFNGQFKAGGLCWLCRGKKDILCGNCNGAGFLGGFMSTFDE